MKWRRMEAEEVMKLIRIKQKAIEIHLVSFFLKEEYI